MTALASSIVVDYDAGQLVIDGVTFPWHIGADGIDVTPGGRDDAASVDISVLVWGTILVRRGGVTLTYDRELGDVRKYARDLVHKGFLDAYPDLVLPEPSTADDRAGFVPERPSETEREES